MRVTPMGRSLGRFALFTAALCTGSGCGTMFNLAGQEPWLMGPAPVRTVDPFGGVDNDIRWMKRGISPEFNALPIVVAAADMPLSLAGDVVTLPWTTYRSLRRRPSPIKISFDKDAMREQLDKILVVGMPIDQAKRIMEDGGFSCRDWPEYVHCSALAGRSFIMLHDVDVTLRHADGKLTNFDVEYRSVGM